MQTRSCAPAPAPAEGGRAVLARAMRGRAGDLAGAVGVGAVGAAHGGEGAAGPVAGTHCDRHARDTATLNILIICINCCSSSLLYTLVTLVWVRVWELWAPGFLRTKPSAARSLVFCLVADHEQNMFQYEQSCWNKYILKHYRPMQCQ